MRRLFSIPAFALSLLALVGPAGPAHAQGTAKAATAETPPTATPPSPTLADASVLGLVEGVTEFLPVSSTGHLIIASSALGLDVQTPITVPGEDGPVPFKTATDAYIVIIQLGAIAAVALLYWRRVVRILAGLIGRDPEGLRLAINVLVACIPAAALGLTVDDWIDAHLFSVRTVAVALIVGAALMLWVEHRRKRRAAAAQSAAPVAETTLENLRPRQALVVGLMQCLALWPGMSRSMVTIVGGYVAGLSPVRAAEFSFLVGLPLLSAAAALKTLKDGPAVLAAYGAAPIAVGIVVAAVSAAVAVKFLVGFLTRHGLGAFAWYRLALAAALLVFTA